MTLTRARTIQYVGILFALGLIAVGYWYFSARAGVKTNTSASQSQGNGRLDSGLAGYWKLDENTGTSAADASTNGNTGTLTNGPTWTTGQIGSGVAFDGSNDSIALSAGLGILKNVSQATLAGWYNVSSVSGTERDIISLSINSGSPTTNSRASAYLNSTGKFTCGGRSTDGETFQAVDTTATYPTGRWVHFACTINYATNTIKIYLDGAAQATTGTPAFAATATANTTSSYNRIGAEDDGSAFFFLGSLDEIRIYNRGLSADEIGQLYRLTAPTSVDTSLKGYWSFNGQDMSSTTAYDMSGAGNTGTLTNGP
ncbi:MAG: LamG domain-containing protein, partial [Undibacterium sp.]